MKNDMITFPTDPPLPHTTEATLRFLKALFNDCSIMFLNHVLSMCLNHCLTFF